MGKYFEYQNCESQRKSIKYIQITQCFRKRSLLTVRATCWEDLPPLLPRNFSTDKELSLLDAKSSSSLAPFTETSLNIKNSSERECHTTQEEVTPITNAPAESSGEPLEACFPTRPKEVLLLLPD